MNPLLVRRSRPTMRSKRSGRDESMKYTTDSESNALMAETTLLQRTQTMAALAGLMKALVHILGTSGGSYVAHLSPDKQEAPRISSSPSKENCVSPRLAMNNPPQITSTTKRILRVITSNLNTTAHSRILAHRTAKERQSEKAGVTQLVHNGVRGREQGPTCSNCSSLEDSTTIDNHTAEVSHHMSEPDLTIV